MLIMICTYSLHAADRIQKTALPLPIVRHVAPCHHLMPQAQPSGYMRTIRTHDMDSFFHPYQPPIETQSSNSSECTKQSNVTIQQAKQQVTDQDDNASTSEKEIDEATEKKMRDLLEKFLKTKLSGNCDNPENNQKRYIAATALAELYALVPDKKNFWSLCINKDHDKRLEIQRKHEESVRMKKFIKNTRKKFEDARYVHYKWRGLTKPQIQELKRDIMILSNALNKVSKKITQNDTASFSLSDELNQWLKVFAENRLCSKSYNEKTNRKRYEAIRAAINLYRLLPPEHFWPLHCIDHESYRKTYRCSRYDESQRMQRLIRSTQDRFNTPFCIWNGLNKSEIEELRNFTGILSTELKKFQSKTLQFVDHKTNVTFNAPDMIMEDESDNTETSPFISDTSEEEIQLTQAPCIRKSISIESILN